MCLEQTRTSYRLPAQIAAVALLQGECGYPLLDLWLRCGGTLRARLPLLELRLRDTIFFKWLGEGAMAAWQRHQKQKSE